MSGSETIESIWKLVQQITLNINQQEKSDGNTSSTPIGGFRMNLEQTSNQAK